MVSPRIGLPRFESPLKSAFGLTFTLASMGITIACGASDTPATQGDAGESVMVPHPLSLGLDSEGVSARGPSHIAAPDLRGEVPTTKSRNLQVEPPDNSQRFEHFRSRLAERLGRDRAGLEQQHPNATVTRIPLQRRFGHAAAARRGHDGRIEYGCFDHPDPAARFLAATPGEAKP